MGCRKMERMYVIPTITRKIQVINNNNKSTTYICISSKTSHWSIGGETCYLQGIGEDFLQIEGEIIKSSAPVGEVENHLRPPAIRLSITGRGAGLLTKLHPLYPRNEGPAECILD